MLSPCEVGMSPNGLSDLPLYQVSCSIPGGWCVESLEGEVQESGTSARCAPWLRVPGV